MPVPGDFEPTAPRPSVQPTFNDLMLGALPSGADQGRISDKPNHPWVYVHNPESWEIADVDGEATLLPALTTIRLGPGLNHVGTRKQGAEPTDHLKLAFQELLGRGLTVISANNEVPAAALPKLPRSATVRGYIAEYPARDPDTSISGTLNQELWQVPTDTPPRERQRWDFDSALFNVWRKHLVESGQVRPCPAKIKRDLLNKAKARHERRLSVGYQPEVRVLKLAESAARVASVEQAVSPAAAAEKPRTGGRAKADKVEA